MAKALSCQGDVPVWLTEQESISRLCCLVLVFSLPFCSLWTSCSYFEFVSPFDSLTWLPFFPSPPFTSWRFRRTSYHWFMNVWVLLYTMCSSKHFIHVNSLKQSYELGTGVPIVQLRQLPQDFLVAHYLFPTHNRNLSGRPEVDIKWKQKTLPFIWPVTWPVRLCSGFIEGRAGI